ncbi:MAG: CDP-diacylglycerol--glycerol-3-phosphate 3-phosphatidyltransferase [Massiliimalia sp.]|jgi:CDP-diacylglycerol--glycerol-3-phosphate 3-phosphatidyltransferase
MNLPNKLTVLRIIMVPFFVLFLLVDGIPYHYLWALLVFAAASITDCLDGKIARKYNLITNFGKFLDPLADKVLVLAAMIGFIELGLSSSVVVIIVIAREFLVTSLRLVAASDGTVIAASIYGKVKTVSQMVSIVGILLLESINQFVTIGFDIALLSNILMWITAVITVISGVDYLLKNKSCINTTK